MGDPRLEGHPATGRSARQLTEREPLPGMVVYVGGQPVGRRCSGLRSQMGRLVRSRTIPLVDERPVWSVVCFIFACTDTTSFDKRAGSERVMLTQAKSGGRPRWILRKEL